MPAEAAECDFSVLQLYLSDQAGENTTEGSNVTISRPRIEKFSS
jgi:hypothetical protein